MSTTSKTSLKAAEKVDNDTQLIVANFGGPRSLEEVPSFLTALLTDIDVIRTPLPRFFEKWLFQKIALKRAHKVAEDYRLIGGKSPIFEDTEALAHALRLRLNRPVMTFHRYLVATHKRFFRAVRASSAKKFLIFPLYPQFSFATTGSTARFFAEHLPASILNRTEWIKSYPTHPAYVAAMQRCIADFLQQEGLKQEEVVLFFSAHGLPQKFVDEGDPYEHECQTSFEAIRQFFPAAHSLLAFQSKFGPGQWLRPYTSDLCSNPAQWNQGREHIVFIPLSFTSDHIETLFEVEYQYVAAVRERGLKAYRCPALNRREDWTIACLEILHLQRAATKALIRS